MKQIDLDDLPPRVASILAGLESGEAMAVVRGGLVVTRLVAFAASRPGSIESETEQPPEETLKEVMAQFNAMIHDEF